MGLVEQGQATAAGQQHDFRQGFAALEQEHNGWIDDIRGDIPADLKGTFFRNGPGTMKAGSQQYGHWFDGPGMISAVTFAGGRAHFRNRYVRTPRYLQDKAAGRIRSRGFGTQIEGGLAANFLRPMANPANTSISWHGDKLCAFYEGGQPYRLDPATLETLGKELYEGGLTSVMTMSAHGKVDSGSGHQINFGLNIAGLGLAGLKLALDVYDIDPQGRICRTCRVPLTEFPFLHDFGLTQNYAIFLLSSISFSLPGPLLGTKAMSDTMAFNMGQPVHAIVVDLRTMQVAQRFELPAGIVVHFGNSHEVGDEIVTELIQSNDLRNFSGLSDVFSLDQLTGGPIFRYRFNVKTGQVSHEQYHHAPCGEFPAWNRQQTGRPSRYSYYVAPLDNGTPFTFNAVIKLDTDTGDYQARDYGRDHYTSEALFAPREGATAEDDGYLLSFVYDATRHKTDVVILDARNPQDEVAAVKLSHHVPLGFHGHFTNEVFVTP
ncbi:MAG: carotenoid oxygenase family protein [Halieaceae bacterium]|jgi:all-trans-8'-apo-beta-carotenal 15,15'-oxygenase|nr:carotenoid oxygenase family protein [Halieaceae bacterium]